MVSRAPTYYHWSLDKPCTTNQVYGYKLKDSMVEVKLDRKLGPFDYTRPFSNSAFFPQIAPVGNSLTTSTANNKSTKTAKSKCASASAGGKPINRGYITGHVPVTEKMVRSSVPAGFKLSRSQSAPANGLTQGKAKADQIYLWHTLAGSLVHVNNYPGESAY